MFLYCAIHILRYSDCSRGLKVALTFILLSFKPPCCNPPQPAETPLFLGGALQQSSGKGKMPEVGSCEARKVGKPVIVWRLLVRKQGGGCRKSQVS